MAVYNSSAQLQHRMRQWHRAAQHRRGDVGRLAARSISDIVCLSCISAIICYALAYNGNEI